MRLLRSPGWLWGGLLGTLICCFTPILAILFGFVGLGALTGYLDYALMPLLGFFIAALSRVASWQGHAWVAWTAGGAGVVGFSVLFGRGTPIFAGLIVAGALLAFAVYRR